LHPAAIAASDSSDSILTINGGSSSIRFALYADADDLTCRLEGKVDRIGSGGATLHFDDHRSGRRGSQAVAAGDLASAARALTDWLAASGALGTVTAIGHRVVHGMGHAEPALVDADLLSELHGIEVADPDHLPGELELIEIFRRAHPRCPQVACFDTAFHHDMPRVASLLPIPRRYAAQGLRRYGFHGLSYAYLVEQLAQVAGTEASRRRVVMAHLGNGASLAALRDGKSVDTSMGFTPAAGIPMGTRSGDLDPGLAAYLHRTERMTTEGFSNMVNRESGLIGISETSADMRDLLASEATDVRAAEAVAVFCYQVRKWIGAYAAVLGGLDTLVFSGGIGESAAVVRERICDGLDFLGIELDPSRNDANADVISRDVGRVDVRVIPTNEQLMIARSVRDVIGRKRTALSLN
jgi:acetate kinase